jgi:hypothetical protein
MPMPTRSSHEAGINDLLNEEIGRLLLRADRVERREVDALMTRVLSLRFRTTEVQSRGEVLP